MKKENTAFKIIGIFFAVILSIIFVAVLISASVYTSARSMLSAKTIINIISDTAFDEYVDINTISDEILPDDENVQKAKAFVVDILESDALIEVLDLYMDDTVDAISGSLNKEKFTIENVDRILARHEKAFADIITSHYPELNSSEVEEGVSYLRENLVPEIFDNMPAPREIANEFSKNEYSGSISHAFSVSALVSLWVTAFIIAALIFVCRLFEFRGLKWIGIDAIVAAVLLIILYVAAKTFSAAVFTNTLILSTALSFLFKILICGIILLVTGILLIVLYVCLGAIRSKKENNEAPVEASL